MQTILKSVISCVLFELYRKRRRRKEVYQSSELFFPILIIHLDEKSERKSKLKSVSIFLYVSIVFIIRIRIHTILLMDFLENVEVFCDVPWISFSSIVTIKCSLYLGDIHWRWNKVRWLTDVFRLSAQCLLRNSKSIDTFKRKNCLQKWIVSARTHFLRVLLLLLLLFIYWKKIKISLLVYKHCLLGKNKVKIVYQFI